MIVWFSGTGNSRVVAERLAERLGETTMAIRGDFRELLAGVLPQERVVWVCPVYGWRVPPVVEEAVMAMSECAGVGAEHWLVVTCGDDVGETPRYWRELLARRGWRSAAVYSVRMPNTYVFLPGFDVDKPEVAEAKLEAAPGAVDSIARAIAGGESDVDWVRPGAFPALKSRVLSPVFRRHFMLADGFRVDPSRCIGCGNCVHACPLGNVRLSASRMPEWGTDCAFCTACYHCCPQGAITHGMWSHGKGRYVGPSKL